MERKSLLLAEIRKEAFRHIPVRAQKVAVLLQNRS